MTRFPPPVHEHPHFSNGDVPEAAEGAPADVRPGKLQVTTNLTGDLSEKLLALRALRAFEHDAGGFSVHRSLRIATRRPLAELLNDLAINSGLDPHRLEEGYLLMGTAHAFVRVHGHRKTDYSSCQVSIWADGVPVLRELEAKLLALIGEQVGGTLFTIDWRFVRGDGQLVGATFEEIADPALLDEAYPTLEGVERFIQRYLASRETVLILQGPPGTGKTRLVRAILAELSRRKGESASVLYTADKKAIESDEIFVDFLTGHHDAFVIEDADHLLAPRTDGNQDIHRFLTTADGIVRAQGRKIIFTTNLPNVGDIDEALLRPGRCFARLGLRLLTAPEIEGLLYRLCDGGNEDSRYLRAYKALFVEKSSNGTASLAEIYRAAGDT